MADVLYLVNHCLLPRMGEVKVAGVTKKYMLRNTRNKLINSLFQKLQLTEAFILDAETQGLNNNSINTWLKLARDVCGDVGDLLDEFVYRSSTSSSGFYEILIELKFLHQSLKVNKKFKIIYKDASDFIFTGQRLLDIDAQPTGRETSSVGSDKLYGREEEIATLANTLLQQTNVNYDNKEQERRNVAVIFITGMGGIGKTALAQKIFNDQKISDHFEAKGWAHVSENSSYARVVKNIISSLTGKETNLDDGFDTLQLHLRSVVEEKRFLLVLDDVWTEDPWWELIMYSVAYAAEGSRILVTTRNPGVAMTGGGTMRCHLKGLSAEPCWRLFSERAFHGSSAEERDNLVDVARKIVAKCDGLPLAAKVVGNLLRAKRTLQEWESVLQNETFVAHNSLFPVLQLSYSHLNTRLKRCLAYCRIFPKDHSIETDTLIKLWMAQGYISSSQNEGTEEIGYSVLQNLQMDSFFQDTLAQDSKTCKIHGVMHDFLHSLQKKDCITMEVDRTGLRCELPISEDARHSTLVIAGQSSLPVSVCELRKLRTLLILSEYAFVSTRWLQQMFKYLKLLRALHFSCCSIEKIPKQLGKLHQLRYLNLSYNRNLKKLPDTLCNLYYLQTLNLNGCDHLEKLPEEIGKLTNLRHLEILWTSSLGFLPRGVGKLSSLRTLNRFVVSSNSGTKACSLGDLEKLKKLQGYLYIDGLADLASADEAGKASLDSKKRLFGLDLWFSGVGTDKVKLGKVLEALQPPSALQYLGIHYYGGTILPTWMASLTKLTELILFNCTNCESFSSVATLPCLESLELRDMDMKEVSFEVEVSSNTAFPELKRLCIYNMKQLNDWKVTVGGAAASQCSTLLQLSIGNCPELEALPHHLQAKELEELSISECPKLKKWLQTTENMDKTSHIRSIKIDGQDPRKGGPSSSNLASSSSRLSRTFTRVTSSRFQGL